MDETRKHPSPQEKKKKTTSLNGGERAIQLLEILGKTEGLQTNKPKEQELLSEWGLAIKDNTLQISSDSFVDIPPNPWPDLWPQDNKTRITCIAATLKNNEKRLIVIRDDNAHPPSITFLQNYGRDYFAPTHSSSLSNEDLEWLASQVSKVEATITGTQGKKWSINHTKR